LDFLRDEFLRVYSQSVKNSSATQAYAFVTVNAFFVVLVTYLSWVTFQSAQSLARVSLKKSDRETMDWIGKNTVDDARFLLMTSAGQINPMADAYQEWFPVLAGRQSQNTLQGKEWVLGSQFYEYSLQLIDLQACKDVSCLQDWALNNDIQIEYLLVRIQHVSPELPGSIQMDGGFQVVYESSNTVIYKSTP